MAESVILKNITKKYRMYETKGQQIADLIFPGKKGSSFNAIENITFSVEEGDVVGLVDFIQYHWRTRSTNIWRINRQW